MHYVNEFSRKDRKTGLCVCVSAGGLSAAAVLSALSPHWPVMDSTALLLFCCCFAAACVYQCVIENEASVGKKVGVELGFWFIISLLVSGIVM